MRFINRRKDKDRRSANVAYRQPANIESHSEINNQLVIGIVPKLGRRQETQCRWE